MEVDSTWTLLIGMELKEGNNAKRSSGGERIELEIYHRDCQYGFLIKEEGRVGE